MAAYEYKGTQRGEADPWIEPEPPVAPKPTPKPKPAKRVPQRARKTVQHCGTKAAHKRHIYKGEEPCDPCREAKAIYDRTWRAGQVPSATRRTA